MLVDLIFALDYLFLQQNTVILITAKSDMSYEF